MQLIRCLLSNFLSQHVSGIIMLITKRIRPCPTACSVLPGCVGHGLVELHRELCALCGSYRLTVSHSAHSSWSCVVSCVHCVKVTVRLFHTVHTAHDAAPQDHSQPQPTHPGRTPHAVGHHLILLMMGIMMPETC